MISTIHEVVKGVKENTLLGGATFVPPTKKKRNSVHVQVLLSVALQGMMFPEVSQPQALLGSLVSIS
jgi:hypothetical protein